MRHLSSRIAVTAAALAFHLIACTSASAASPQPIGAEHGMVVTAQRLASEVGVAVLQAGRQRRRCGGRGRLCAGGRLSLLRQHRRRRLHDRSISPTARDTSSISARRRRWRRPRPCISTPTATSSRARASTATRPSACRARCAASTRRAKHTARMSREAVMAPAIALAPRGLRARAAATPTSSRRRTDALRRDPDAAAIFLRTDGPPYQPGDRLVQPELAATLRAHRRRRRRCLLRGPIAEAIVGGAAGQWRHPDRSRFRGYTVRERRRSPAAIAAMTSSRRRRRAPAASICARSSTSSKATPCAELGFHSAPSVHLMVEAMRHAYVDRNTVSGRSRLSCSNPLDRLSTEDYAAGDPRRDRPGQGRRRRPTLGARRRAAREAADHALFGDRQRRQRGRRHLHDQQLFRRRRHRAGHRLLPQRRDGRFHRQAGRAEPVRPGPGRGQRHRAGQAAAVLDEPDHGRPRTASRSWCSAAPAARASSPSSSRRSSTSSTTAWTPQEAVDAPRFHHQWLPDRSMSSPSRCRPTRCNC